MEINRSSAEPGSQEISICHYQRQPPVLFTGHPCTFVFYYSSYRDEAGTLDWWLEKLANGLIETASGQHIEYVFSIEKTRYSFFEVDSWV